ncbi:recombinase family protein [Streptomyces sp. NPDC017638]|uniref:recombinase family protein n=1 Tax=Streptomyces sp. NPDC017638 TaxID=3365004 RepID=UPI00378C9039
MNESIGYAGCSLDEQDLTAQRGILLGVAEDRTSHQYGPTGTNRDRPGLDQVLAAVRAGDTLVAPEPDRLVRSVPDARVVDGSLVSCGVELSLGGTHYDPADPMGKTFFNTLTIFAEFEMDLLRMRTHGGMAVAGAEGKLKGRQLEPTTRQRANLVKEHHSGGHTIAGPAELFSVSRATVYRALERIQNANGDVR